MIPMAMATLAILSVFALGLGGYFYGQASAARNSALILARVMPGTDGGDELVALDIPPRRLAESPRLQRWLRGTPMVASTAQFLSQTGRETTVAVFFGITLAAFTGAAFLTSAAGCLLPSACFAGLLAASVPFGYFYRLKLQRLAAFEAQLPQVLELLTLYLRSGRSLPQAFVATADESPAPACEELAQCAEEYRLGRPLPQAIKGLAQKYPSAVGLKLFAIAVSVLGQTGGNLVEVLDRIRRTLQSSITYVLKLRSLTGEARNSARILGAIPGLFMGLGMMLNPDYVNVYFSSLAGYLVLAAFLVLWVAGIIWVQVLMASRA